VKELKKKYATCKASYVPFDNKFEQLRTAIQGQLDHDDLLLLLGAGKLTHFARELSEEG